MTYKGGTGKEFISISATTVGELDLIEGLIYIDNWNIFEPKVEIWTKYKKIGEVFSLAV